VGGGQKRLGTTGLEPRFKELFSLRFLQIACKAKNTDWNLIYKFSFWTFLTPAVSTF